MTKINTSKDFDASAKATQVVQATVAPETNKSALLIEMNPLTRGMPQRMQMA